MRYKRSQGILNVLAGAMAMLATGAMAQTPGPSQSRAGNGLDSIGVIDRTTVFRQIGLDENAIGLTPDQKIQVEKIADTYATDQKALRDKYPVKPGVPSTPEAMAARQAARIKFTTALRQVLTADQRKTWQAALVARVPQSSRQQNAAPPVR